MSRLSSLKLDALRRPAVIISALSLVIVVAGWWFAWMKPEGAKLSTVNAQIQTKTTQLHELEATLAASEHDAAIVKLDGSYLQRFTQAVPPSPEPQVLTTEIFQLARRTVGAQNLKSLTDDTTVAPAAGQALSEIPMAITINGPHNECMAFLDGLYKLTRLITVSSVTPTPQSSTNGTPQNVLVIGKEPYTMSISATAYFSPTLG